MAVLAGTEDGSKASVVVASDASTDASTTVRELAAVVGGKGGGKPDLAMAGGPDVARIDDLLAEARRRLGGS